MDQTETHQYIHLNQGQSPGELSGEEQQQLPNAEISINMNQLLMDTLNNQFNYGVATGNNQSEQRDLISAVNPSKASNTFKPRHLSTVEQRQDWIDHRQVEGLYQN